MKHHPRALRNPAENVGLLHVLNDGFLASLPLLLPFIRADISLGFGWIGALSSLLGSATVVLALPSASLARRFGGMRILRLAALLYASSFFIAGSAAGLPSLALAFAVGSVAFGVFHPIAFALVAQGSAAGEVGRRMGAFTAVGDIGRVGISAAVTFLVAATSWRATAFIYGAVPLALFAAAAVLFRSPKADRSVPAAKDRAEAPGLRRNGKFLLAVAAGGLDSLASSSLFIFLPFLLAYRDIPGAFLGSLSGAFFVGNMLGKLVSGKITDRFSGFRVFVVSEILMAALLVVLSAERSVALLALLSVLLGAVTKGTVPVVSAIIADSVADRGGYEKAYGVMSFVNGIAGIAAPLALGVAAERWGIVSVFRLAACFALVAIVPGFFYPLARKTALGAR